MTGSISTKGKSASYEIPATFSVEKYLVEARTEKSVELYLRSGRALGLRNRAVEVPDENAPMDWQRVSISYQDQERLIEEILWYADDACMI